MSYMRESKHTFTHTNTQRHDAESKGIGMLTLCVDSAADVSEDAVERDVYGDWWQ